MRDLPIGARLYVAAVVVVGRCHRRLGRLPPSTETSGGPP